MNGGFAWLEIQVMSPNGVLKSLNIRKLDIQQNLRGINETIIQLFSIDKNFIVHSLKIEVLDPPLTNRIRIRIRKYNHLSNRKL